MAGKTGRNKNKGRPTVASSIINPVDSSLPNKDSSVSVDLSPADVHNTENCNFSHNPESSCKPGEVDADMKGMPTTSANAQPKQEEGDHLYPVSVKVQSGEKLELQLSPGDSVMDLRQFLLDAPETCFFTCYDLILHGKDGLVHRFDDYCEISEVADITAGGCSLEMVAAPYDDRSIRSHMTRVRELLSLPTLHSSLSTSLALQHEDMQQASADSSKTEIPELDGLGFMEDVVGSLEMLVSSPAKEIKCVESIIFSSFNPPPSYRRLVGDLLYLDVVTLEGHKFCITGSTRTFYVNSSTGNVLDPRPNKPSSESTTVIGLLQKISPKFKKGFRELLDLKATAHPFENVRALLPPNSWLGVFPIPDHVRNPARAEDALVLSYGSEVIGMQRDWNEELQSCREFPHKTRQERILRDRALYKVSCDFVDAAISGAIGVINRCIPPINPTDPECFHMYVHNNIFFSFAVDADLGQVSKTQESSVKLKIWDNIKHSPSSRDAATETQTDSMIGSEKSELFGETNVVISSEEQITDNEQATYASANNDLKGTKTYQEADVPGLYNLAMAIIDYRGYRVVAQSIIPGILQGDKSHSLLYGSVDNGVKICWNEPFHLKVLEAAKHLHLKEHTVLDGSGNTVKLAAPVECKGIVGSDDRHYLLDLMRATPRDANYQGPGARFCVLRPELVTAFCQAEASERSKSKMKSKDVSAGGKQLDACGEDSSKALSSQSSVQEEKHASLADAEPISEPFERATLYDDIVLNPNVFTEFKLAGSQEEIYNDEMMVKKASLYLIDVVLPKFVEDLSTLEVSPMDGQTLTEALHAHGINVRYIGKVANMVNHLPHVWDQCVTEILVRAAKHIIKDVLRESPDHEVAPAIAHFMNCFLEQDVPVIPKNSFSTKPQRSQKKGGHGISTNKNHSAYAHITSDVLWSDIKEMTKFKYQFELPDNARTLVKRVSVIRNLCQKVGITIAARKYDLNSSSPFQTSDILNLQPVVKHSIPTCSMARDLVEKGKSRLSEGNLNEAYILFSEAFATLQQVSGPMHREVANCCRYLAMVLYNAGDMAGAIMQQHKELIINERCLGLDHPDTAHSYGNMALFYHGLNQTELALRHMARTLLLLSLSCGSDHPDVAATFINVAMMYQDIGKMNIALRYLQEALKKNERLLGSDHIQTAACYHALAIAFNCMGAYKLSLQHETKTRDILLKQLGKEDLRTRDSENWIKTFQMRDLQANVQKQKGHAINSTSAQNAIDILKAHPNLIQAFQAASSGSGNSASAINKSLNASMMGESLPRGRGLDERAARAAAEIRKKAAARGLTLRPQGIPVQAFQPLSQLLNIINSGPGSDSTTSNPKAETFESNVPSNVKDNDSKGNQDGVAPVGLGTGLTVLDSKKPKTKPKTTVT